MQHHSAHAGSISHFPSRHQMSCLRLIKMLCGALSSSRFSILASAADCPRCPKQLNYSMMQTSSRALPALVMVPLGLGTDFGAGSQPSVNLSSMSAGSLLQHSSHNSLIWSMAHEAGHGIAKHLVEIDSWGLVSTVAIFSWLALSGIALLPAMALGCVLSTLTKKIVIDSWLCQQLEHEADVIGTAISRAAGCTPEDVVYAMSCWLDVHHINLINLVNSGVWMKQRAAVAALNGYMPNARLPLPGIGGLDSRDMRRIMATIDKELCLASEDVKRLAHGQVNMLLVSIAESLCYTKNPLEPWLHSHPHKLDRIAHVKSSSYFADSAHQTMIVRGHDGEGQRLLEAFQAYPQWPLFVHSLEKALPGEERVKDMYITCLVSRDRAIRSRVLAASKAEAEREYDPSIKLLALLISVLEKAWAFWA